MEEKLLIVGIVSFVFAKLAKYLKKKGFLQNKTYFVIWNAAFAVTIGTLVYYVLNFMSKNGIEGGLSAKTFALILAATLGGAWYLANKAAKSEEKENEKLYAVNLDWAETVYFAASAPAHIQIAEVLLMPTYQATGTISYKKKAE